MTKEYSMLVSCFITFRDLLEADDMYISSERAYFSSFHHTRAAAATAREHISFLSPSSSMLAMFFFGLFVSDRSRADRVVHLW